MRHTVWIRYRRADGAMVTEGGRWRGIWEEEMPSFERTGMRVHRILQEEEATRYHSSHNPRRLVAVDAMIWKLEA